MHDHSDNDAALALVPHESASHVAVRDGSWFDPTTWRDGVVPGDDAQVLIPVGFTVTYDDVSDARLFTARIDGNLSFATDVDSRMVIDTLVVGADGGLSIGSAEDPVAADVEVELIIANNGDIDVTWDPTLLSRGIVALGDVEIHGQEKAAHLKVVDDPLAGDTSIHFEEAPSGWQVGDTIVIAGTHYEGYNWDNSIRASRHHEPEDEVRVITEIEGGVIHFGEPLVFDHDAPREDLKTSVANYTRNVSISTESSDTAEIHQRGHVMFRHSDDVDVRYAEFHELGRTDKSEPALNPEEFTEIAADSNVKGRYSFHFHRSGTEEVDEPAIAVGNAVFGSPGWGYVHHDSNAILHENASYNTFGAGFVAETGNEIGSWTNNIAIYAMGNSWARPKNGNDVENFDLGQTGDGFWFQGRMVEASGNIAASVNTGFVYFHRGRGSEQGPDGQIAFDPSLFDFPEAVGEGGLVNPDDTPILHFSHNEAFAAKEGLHVVKANPNQGHDIHSVLDNFTAWSVVEGAHFEYTSHYTLIDFDVVGKAPVPFQSPANGISFGPNTTDMIIVRPVIEGFDNSGINLVKAFTDASLSANLHQYKVIDATFTDVGVDYLNYDPALDQLLSSTALQASPVEITLDGPLTYHEGYPDPTARHVSITGVKTDTLGTTALPSGTDNYDIGYNDVIRILEADGYYQTSDGRNFFVAETYFSDRLTGEVFKSGHLVEIDPNVPLGSQFSAYRDAKFNGLINLEDGPPVAGDPVIAQTQIGSDLTLDLLAGATDPTGDQLKVDGIVQPTGGKVFVADDGDITYRPDIGFSGVDSFKYWITDGFGHFTEAWAIIEVSASAIQPVPITYVEHVGDRFDNEIAGGVQHDAIFGRAGDDVLWGRIGDDRITGGDGDDLIYGGSGDDTLAAGKGADTIHAGAGDDVGIGGAGADLMYGMAGADRFAAGAGDDMLFGGGGNDILAGRADDDTLYGQAGDDTLVGGGGTNRIYGGAGDDAINTTLGRNTLVYDEADFGHDELHGFISGNDRFEVFSNVLSDLNDIEIESINPQRTLVRFGDAGGTVTLYGVSSDEVSLDDFTLVPTVASTVAAAVVQEAYADESASQGAAEVSDEISFTAGHDDTLF